GGRAARRRLDEMAMETLALVGLSEEAGWLAEELSHGDQRLLEIAMAIAQRPSLLLLDEPTQGLSVNETRQMVERLRELLRGGGLTVLLVEHDMEVVFAIADHLFVLHKGEIIADGLPEDVRGMESVKDAYLGREAGA
ncbi:MAG: ATP-binding cassette domain-containing protein, partial [Alphaproteobacteria bacterium]